MRLYASIAKHTEKKQHVNTTFRRCPWAWEITANIPTQTSTDETVRQSDCKLRMGVGSLLMAIDTTHNQTKKTG